MPNAYNLGNAKYCSFGDENVIEIYVGNTSTWQCNSTTFIVNAEDGASTAQLKVANADSMRGVKRLLINGNMQDLPTGTAYNQTTAYTVANGSLIRIYGDFSLCGTTAKMTNIKLQTNISIYFMFNQCTSLVEAPELPEGITIFTGMFCRCSNLKKASRIPEGARYAGQMFYFCRALEEAPELPNTLQDCSTMFGDCSSLTVAPEIPVSCTNCSRMFYRCTSLTTLPQRNIDLMANTPTNLSCAGCYHGCTNINCINTNWQTNGLPEIITYADIPAAWKDINQQTLNLEAEEDDYWN